MFVTSGSALRYALGLVAMFSWTGYSEPVVHQSTAFEGEIRAFESSDAKNPPEKGAILFVGSSSIRMWTNLSSVFPGHRVLNRGFGGAYAVDVNYYFDRVVKKYTPSRIVYYAGDNDIAGAVQPEKILADFKEFAHRVVTEIGPIPIAYIAIKPSPSRSQWVKLQAEANRLVHELTKTQANLSYIDVWPAMTDPQGVPRPELFLADRLHMNAKGYAIWRELVSDWLGHIPSTSVKGVER